MTIDAVSAQRAKAELVLQGIIEIRAMRGRLAKVTVDDVALLLAMIDRATVDPEPRDGDEPGRPGPELREALKADVTALAFLTREDWAHRRGGDPIARTINAALDIIDARFAADDDS